NTFCACGISQLYHISRITSTLTILFYSYGNHRDLHSFPTRRSSDLSALLILGSRLMPHRWAELAHWIFRWSVGTTTTTRCTIPDSRSSWATRSAKVVLPAPGVATARKSAGSWAR